MMAEESKPRMVCYSKVMGLLPCEIVGQNGSHYLVKLRGTPKPLSVPRELVFKLEEGVELVNGQLVAAGGEPVTLADRPGGET
jgi:hypothetical protein